MKNRLPRTLIVSLLAGSLLLFGAGCGKKTVIPPDSTSTTSGSDMAGGTSIPYPTNTGGTGYSEESLPIDDTLDNTGVSNTGAGGMAGEMDIDNQSDEYKKAHGRSSANLSPIYFGFDQAGVPSEMTATLIANAEYLKANPGLYIVLQGNCDERGTTEYNLALGERRAINTMSYLKNMGIEPQRMRPLSYGEEKPLFTGFDEESYKFNRRVDFVIE